MARNLLAKGQSVLVYDKVEKQVQEAVKDGAIAASGPADIAQRATTICTMLPARYDKPPVLWSRCIGLGLCRGRDTTQKVGGLSQKITCM